MIDAVIFDIDGTLADCSHRLHYITQKPKDWDSFFGQVDKDRPITEIRDLAFACLISDQFKVIFCTGRPEKTRKATLKWLENQGLIKITIENLDAKDRLFMRKDKDHRPDDEVKQDLLKEIRAAGYNPIVVFEDRSRVVEMWRRNGIKCCQVAPGDY